MPIIIKILSHSVDYTTAFSYNFQQHMAYKIAGPPWNSVVHHDCNCCYVANEDRAYAKNSAVLSYLTLARFLG